MAEVEHFNVPFVHKHPLALREVHKDTSDECEVCFKENEGTVYQCIECDYFAHKHCIELNVRMRHLDEHARIHPFVECEIEEGEESLSLSNSTIINGCRYCSKSISKGDVVYGCRECKYFLHKSCVDSSLDQILLQLDEKEFEHPLHEHPLLLSEILPPDDSYGFQCVICRFGITEGWAYGCSSRSCKFIMHKTCAELPIKPIKHPFHPQHLLTSISSDYNCNACGWTPYRCIALGCITCGFFLHISCCSSSQEELPILKVQHKGHPFFLVKHRLTVISCDCGVRCTICGVDHYPDDVIFRCMYPKCDEYFHVHCVPSPFNVPKSVKFDEHWDPLIFNPEPFAPDGPNEIHYCDICQMKRDVRGRVYHCIEPDCHSDFAAHIGCALSKGLPSIVAEWEISATNTQPDEAAAAADDYDLERKIPAIQAMICYLQQKEMIDSGMASDASKGFNKAEGVYTRYVKSLAKSSSKEELEDDEEQRKDIIRHPLHPPHHLSLLPDDQVRRKQCSWCGNLQNIRIYRCEEDGFQLCEECASSVVPSPKLRLPEHLLFLLDKSPDYLTGLECSKCRQEFGVNDHSSAVAFVCVIPHFCRYALHIHCVPDLQLPEKIKNGRHPDHDLIYTDPENVVINPKEEYYCDDFDCEQQRDPNYPFYYCQECDFGAHISCCISEILPSLLKEYENYQLERGLSLDAFLRHFEDDCIKSRLKKEEAAARLKESEGELKALEEKLSQIENQFPTASTSNFAATF